MQADKQTAQIMCTHIPPTQQSFNSHSFQYALVMETADLITSLDNCDGQKTPRSKASCSGTNTQCLKRTDIPVCLSAGGEGGRRGHHYTPIQRLDITNHMTVHTHEQVEGAESSWQYCSIFLAIYGTEFIPVWSVAVQMSFRDTKISKQRLFSTSGHIWTHLLKPEYLKYFCF